MKRMITLVVAFSVTATALLGFLPAEARVLSGEYADRAALLEYIGLIEPISQSEAEQTFVTRGEFAQYMGGILHLPEQTGQDTRYFIDVPMDHWAAGAINGLTEMGIISIAADKKFRPGDRITCAEALKLLLSVAGYGEYAQARGGYPTGYLQTARELKITASAAGGLLTVEHAVQLLYEALQAPLYTGVRYRDESAVEYRSSEDTLLSVYYDMYGMEGIITYAGGVDLDGQGAAPDNIVRVGGSNYRTELNLMQEVGRFSGFICREVQGDIDEIVLLNTEKKQDETVELSSEDFAEYRDGTVVYFDAKGKKQKAVLAKNAVVVKNGRRMDEDTAGAFAINKGSIRLTDIDSDGTFDYIVIFAYENYIIDTFDAFSGVLYDKLDSTKSISINPTVDTRKIRIQDAAGKELAFADIPAGSVLSVCESEDFVLVTVSTNQITGTVFEISDGEQSIPKLLIGKNESDTQWYQMDREYYLSEFGEKAALPTGISGTYFLDFRGRVALIENNQEDGWQYAYLVAHAMETVFKQELRLKLFLQNGQMKSCKVSQNVRVDGEPRRSGQEALAAINKDVYGKVLAKDEDAVDGQLLRVKLNSDEVVTDMDTEYTVPVSEGPRSLKRTADVQSLYYRWHAGSFNGQFVRNSQTVFFGVPKHGSLKTADDREFQILPSSWFGDKNYTVEGFKLDQESGYESAIVCYDITSDSLSDGYYLVEAAGESMNADGVNVKQLRVWSSSGIASVLQASEDFDFSITEETNGAVRTYTADEGDIIRIGRDFSGAVSNIQIVYDYSRRDDPDYSIAWKAHQGDYYREKGNLMYGYIKSFRDNVLRISWNRPTQEEYENNPQKADYVAPKQNGAVIIFDSSRRSNKVYFGSNADLVSADKLGDAAQPYFLYMTVGIFRGAIIYR